MDPNELTDELEEQDRDCKTPEEHLEALRGKDIIEQCLFPGFEKVRNWGD